MSGENKNVYCGLVRKAVAVTCAVVFLLTIFQVVAAKYSVETSGETARVLTDTEARADGLNPESADAEKGKLPTATAPTDGATKTRTQLYWPYTDAIVNQSRSSTSEDTNYKAVQGVTVWDIDRNAYVPSPDSGQYGYYHKVGIDICSAADARKNIGYSVSQTTGGEGVLQTYWDILCSDPDSLVSIGNNQGAWIDLDEIRWLYGAFYVDAYLAANGFLAFRNFTQGFMDGSDTWMWGSDTDVWNTTAPVFPTPYVKKAVVAAPLWAKVNLVSGVSQIRAGETLQYGFCAIWKDVQLLSNEGWPLGYASFGVRIPRIEWTSFTSMVINYLNKVEFVYGDLGGLSNVPHGAGIQDQTGWHYSAFEPASDIGKHFFPTSQCYQAVKKVDVKYSKYVSTDGGSTWTTDFDSCVAPQVTWANNVPVPEVYVLNMDLLGNWMTATDSPEWWEILAAILYVISFFALFPVSATVTGIVWFLMGLAGTILGLDTLIDGLKVLKYLDVEDADKDWVASHSDASEDINLYANDEWARGCWAAWDTIVCPHLDWYIDTDSGSLSKMHKLVISTDTYFGDIRNPDSTSTMKTVSNEIVIGPADIMPNDETTWLGRSYPSDHSYKMSPKALTVGEIPGYCPDTIAFKAESWGADDYGYDFMGYYSISDELSDDIHERTSGTIRVEGWFKQYDSLPTEYQADGREVYLYMMTPDSDFDNRNDANFVVRGKYRLMDSDEFNAWVFKSVTVYTPALAGKPLKIGIGREDAYYEGYTGQIAVEWAGLKIFGQKMSTSSQWYDVFALTTSVNECMEGDDTNPNSQLYGHEVSMFDTEDWPITTVSAVPVEDQSGNDLTRVGCWIMDDRTYAPILEYGTDNQNIDVDFSDGKDHKIHAEFLEASNYIVYVCPPSPFTATVSPLGAVSAVPGSVVTVLATSAASSSWVFSYWTDGDGNLLTYDNPLRLTVTCNIVIKSVWWAGGCVAEGTLVTMADGSHLPVEQLEIGDRVLGYDLATGTFVTEVVQEIMTERNDEILNINEGALRVTPYHQPIYVRNSAGEGWIMDPREIQIGWEILDLENGCWVSVYSLEMEYKKTRVYDFQTDGPQTYLANGYLVLDKPIRG